MQRLSHCLLTLLFLANSLGMAEQKLVFKRDSVLEKEYLTDGIREYRAPFLGTFPVEDVLVGREALEAFNAYKRDFNLAVFVALPLVLLSGALTIGAIAARNDPLLLGAGGATAVTSIGGGIIAINGARHLRRAVSLHNTAAAATPVSFDYSPTLGMRLSLALTF